MAKVKTAVRGMGPLAVSNVVNARARMLGEDMPARRVLAAAGRAYPELTVLDGPAHTDGDYTLIDPHLTVARAADPAEIPPPRSGLGYAGFTAEQRSVLLDWLADPAGSVPQPYQDFYLAHLEVRLLEVRGDDRTVHGRLTALQATQPWCRHAGLARAIMLGFFLYNDGPGLANWLTTTAPPDGLFDLGLGLQALLEAPISSAQLGEIMVRWSLAPDMPPVELLRSRLDSLTAALGAPPLEYARVQWDDAALTPLPWRCLHRDLRLAIPQPAVRPYIEPALAEVLRVAAVEGNAFTPEAATAEAAAERHTSIEAEGRVVLEFQHSRSEYFDYVLDVARRMEGFSQLMDEDRHIIYRVTFRKTKMRSFWRIWDYVQSWNSTRVYVDGEELEKWKIWPYSQYLR